MQPFWLACWSLALSLGWLLPNHYRPWLAFHSDAWISIVLLLSALAVCFRSKKAVLIYSIEALAAIVIVLIWCQHFFGLIPFSGWAWISSIYLAGFITAILAGACWERATPNQFADALFFAIGAAAVLSVGIQLYQWFQLDGLALWIMDGGEKRPHANLGQPNQLATFLIWGLLAVGWGTARKLISSWGGIFIAAYLLFGIALTGSRTAWIGVFLIVAAAWFWRTLCFYKKMPVVATALGAYFIFCVLAIAWMQKDHASELNVIRLGAELRPIAWKMFLDAISHRPLVGYGWNQTTLAQVSVATDHPYIPGVFSYAHNLFLDLLIWCGIPLGLFMAGVLLHWLWGQFKKVSSIQNALLFLLILVTANHAMFENPLYFGYFLFPIGMVIGVMNVRASTKPLLSLSRYGFALIVTTTTSLLILVIHDYMQVEENYGITRLQWQHIQVKPPKPLDVVFLTQWEDFFAYAKSEPESNLNKRELMWRENVTDLFPSALFFHKLAVAQALNGRPESAELTLQRMCKMIPKLDQKVVKDAWMNESKKNKEISVVPWPSDIC